LLSGPKGAPSDLSPTGRRSHPYLVRARRSYRGSAPPPQAKPAEPPPSRSLRSLHRSSFKSLTPPNSHAKLADGFVKRARIRRERFLFLSCPRTMHDEIRTGPPWGHVLTILHCREAQTKTILSFKNLEAALPPGIPAGRRSNSRSSVRYMPELATIGSIPAANGRSAWRDREVWMQSEPRRPDGVLNVRRRARGEEGAADRDSFMRTVPACMSARSLIFLPITEPSRSRGMPVPASTPRLS
jgi:hypothetical protein